MRNLFAALAIVAALLSDCTAQVAQPPGALAQAAEGISEPFYRQALEARQPVYRVDPARSLVVIEVRRGGPLAGLAHDHVVASHDVHGYVAPEAGRADLEIQLDRLIVDEPPLRAEAGFTTQLSEGDIAGIRKNMLEKVLEADRYPSALVHVTRDGAQAKVSIALHGTTKAMQVPVAIENTADEVVASGRLAFKQTDFGIVPYSFLGGAIQVQDELQLRFTIRARRVEH
jgi:polyisoprenoid-binding protein YceI